MCIVLCFLVVLLLNSCVPSDAERIELMKQLIKRCFGILEIENIKYDPKVIAAFVKEHYPDARSIIKAMGSTRNVVKLMQGS
ncbi:clamp-loader subunit [Klebsiella phage CPRSB]|nr:clamp-loader subunit [Klebsiella phage CPRSB]